MKTSSFCSAIKNLNCKRTACSVCLSVKRWKVPHAAALDPSFCRRNSGAVTASIEAV